MFEAHVHLGPWWLPLVATSALVLTASAYLRGWLRLRSFSTVLFPFWRLAAFMAGLFAVWTAAVSPLAILDHQSLTIHMVKHLLLMTIAAPLILAGAPLLPLLRGISSRFSQSDMVISDLQWFEHHLPHPVFCWLAGAVAVIGWHLPAAFQLALRSHWAHAVEDACFLLAGLLFWWPVVQCLETRSFRWPVVLYLFLATLPCDILAAFLAFSNRTVYLSYVGATQLFSMSPLEDQQCAGALMWVWITFAYLIPAVAITMQILSPLSAQSHKSVETPWRGLPARPLNGSGAESL